MWISSYSSFLAGWVSSWTLSYRRWFSYSSIDNSLLNSNFLTESLQRIFSFKLLKFNWSVLIKELINWKISTTNSYLNVIFLNLDCNSLCTKLIDSFGFSHEHNLQFRSFWIVVNEFCQLFIDCVFFYRNIYCDSLFQINNVLLQCFNFNFGIFKLFQKLKRSLISFIHFFFKLKNVISCIFKFFLKIIFLNIKWIVYMNLSRFKLLFNILFFCNDFFERNNSGFMLQNHWIMSLNLEVLTVNGILSWNSQFFIFIFQLCNSFVFRNSHLKLKKLRMVLNLLINEWKHILAHIFK